MVGDPNLNRHLDLTLTEGPVKLSAIAERVSVDYQQLISSAFVKCISNFSLRFADMTKSKSKAAERITPSQEKSKGIAIKEDEVTSKGTTSKLSITTGKGKGKRPTSARKTITLDPNIPSWARGFCRAVHVFLADSLSTDLGESSTVVPPEEKSQRPCTSTNTKKEINRLRSNNDKLTNVLSPEGKDQIYDEIEQSACRRAVPRSYTISPNDSECEDAEGKS
uniref:Uncharacterized protein n=1 Tax=Solanum tuberosum TaxID=4113 RepID=M1DQA1_SOLTU